MPPGWLWHIVLQSQLTAAHLCSSAQCLFFFLCTLTAAVLLGALLPWLQASLLPQTGYLPLIKAFSECRCFDPGLGYVVLLALPYLHVDNCRGWSSSNGYLFSRHMKLIFVKQHVGNFSRSDQHFVLQQTAFGMLRTSEAEATPAASQ